MLTSRSDFQLIAEINPPDLPNGIHHDLGGRWDNVLITDNVFGKIRVSPYAFAARITHDVPAVHPTVVASTRDRNVLAIESEVRGALGNGVDSFLVVVGDTRPYTDHLAYHYEVVQHLTELQAHMPPFEVGMPTRFRRWQFEKRMELGAQFFLAGPIIDPDTLSRQTDRLGREEGDPPVFLMILPPFSLSWVERSEDFGCVPASDEMKSRLADMDSNSARQYGWEQAARVATSARDAGFAGAVITGVKFETIVSDAALWRAGLGI